MNLFVCTSWANRRLMTAVILLSTAISSVAAAQGTVVFPATVSEYRPFTVTVITAQPYCVGFPVVGDMRYSENTLYAVLTHVDAPNTQKRCGGQTALQRRVTLPGLPRGQQSLRLEVTDESISGGVWGARVAETISATVKVEPISGGDLQGFWMGSVTAATGADAGKVLAFGLTPNRVSIFLGQLDWLDVGAPEIGYTFKAIGASADVTLPETLVRLQLVAYPAPYNGSFWTVDPATARRLAAEWGKTAVEYPFAVGKLVAGACPIGMSPVYQAFHANTVTHRWTQSRTAYVTMLSNGYQGDGPAWCAPALRGE